MSQDKFMQHSGVETGYFDKRRKQFSKELAKGIKSVNQPKPKSNVKPKEKNDGGKQA